MDDGGHTLAIYTIFPSRVKIVLEDEIEEKNLEHLWEIFPNSSPLFTLFDLVKF